MNWPPIPSICEGVPELLFAMATNDLLDGVPLDALLRMLPWVSLGFKDSQYVPWNSMFWQVGIWHGALWS